jgi:hypothetical protein
MNRLSNIRTVCIVGSRVATSAAAALINVGFIWVFHKSVDLVAVMV